ncbi:DUF1508 domain-containing protein [Balneolaceae bacterium ANBcel3]|nr:DUF1508 domain-containing protein [Balneolaceae bacterium ANBcel3]
MKQALTISRKPDLTPAQNYEQLRKEGLAHIEKLSGNLWTDYNSHDPGITLLELLCYGITDLAWRTRHRVQNVLAEATGYETEKEKQFYTAREILATAPVTLNDYRKRIIDVKGVRNAWFIPKMESSPSLYVNTFKSRLQYKKEEDTPLLSLQGLYDIKLELEADPMAGDLNDYTFGLSAGDSNQNYEQELLVDVPSWEVVFDALGSDTSIKDVTIQKDTDPANKKTGLKVTIEVTHTKELNLKGSFTVTDSEIKTSDINSLIKSSEIEERYRQRINKALEIAHQVRALYHKNRNLCEDLVSMKGLDPEDIGVCATVHVSSDAEISTIKASIYQEVSEYIMPDIPFYSLHELIKEGLSVDQIFDGPALEHGFIKDSDLAGAQLKAEVRASEIINRIMKIEGVESIESFSMASGYKGKPVKKNAEWNLPVTSGRSARFNPRLSKIVFYKEGLPFSASEEEVQLKLDQIQLEKRKQKMNTHTENDFPVPKGSIQNLSEYTPLSLDLPDTYGVGVNGPGGTATTERKVQAAQLQAYILIFDQLLANYLAQLTSLRHLFSFDKQLRSTRFSQTLIPLGEKVQEKDGILSTRTELPGVWTVIEHFSRFINQSGLTPGDLESKKIFEEAKKEFLKGLGAPDSPVNSYLEYLRTISETPYTFHRRRSEFLDHLLSRFGEDVTNYVLLVTAGSDESVRDRLIEDKIRFLEELPELSSQRLKSYDYTDRNHTVNTDNVSGFKKRLCRLTGIPNYSRRSLLCKEADKFFEVYKDVASKWRYRFRVEDGSVLLRSAAYSTRKECEEVIVKVKKYGGLAGNYEFLESRNYRYYFNLLDEQKQFLGTGLLFPDPESRGRGLKFLMNKVGVCNKEGFHLIEHILLRPHEEKEKLLPVCLNKEGLDCPGFRDPYSYRISIIVPSWPERFRSMAFRRFFERKIRLELPAHIHAKICWVSEDDMADFEKAYFKWLKHAGNPKDPRREDATNVLIEVMSRIRNVYPVSRLHTCEEEYEFDSILLDQSILGTIKHEDS